MFLLAEMAEDQLPAEAKISYWESQRRRKDKGLDRPLPLPLWLLSQNRREYQVKYIRAWVFTLLLALPQLKTKSTPVPSAWSLACYRSNGKLLEMGQMGKT